MMAQLHGKNISKAQPKRPAISEALKLEIAERTKRRELLTEVERREVDRRLTYAAAEKGNKEEIVRLLKKGADIDAYGNYCETALLGAAWRGRTGICRFLIENGADIEAREKDELKTPLMFAVGCGKIEICKLLLEKGANIEAKDSHGETALLKAMNKGSIHIINILRVYPIFGKDYKKFSSAFKECVK